LSRGGNRPLHGNCREDAEKVAGVFHKMSNVGKPPPIRDVTPLCVNADDENWNVNVGNSSML
jgi:hypothetical protein